jgi:hypothetical protein
LNSAVRPGNWELQHVTRRGSDGPITANLVRDDGEDLADYMVVYGYAAQTDGRWDWCGTNANLHQPLDGEPAPHGPSLWWPSNQMFDRRAAE